MGWLRQRKTGAVLTAGGPRRRPRQMLLVRLRRVVVLVAAVLVVLGALRHSLREAARRAAVVEIEQIVQASRRFREDYGRCPHDSDELVHPPAGGASYLARSPADPWGRSYFYQCPGRWRPEEVDVASMGPDGQWDGGDDITTDL